jgi:hypothetical protein
VVRRAILARRGRYAVESKDDMKKRLKRSPDRGDAFVLAVAAFVDQNHRLELPEVTDTAEFGTGATF